MAARTVLRWGGFLLGMMIVLLGWSALQARAAEEAGDALVTVIYRGELLRTTAREETVEQLLARLELEVTREDTLSHGTQEPAVGGMTLRVDRVVTRQETYTSAIPHDTTSCEDPSLPEGSWEVLIRGRDGEVCCTAEVTYINGKEVSRTLLREYQTVAPVTEVVAWGTGAAPQTEEVDPKALPVIEDGYIRLPTGEVLTYTGTATVRASAYTHTDEGCDLITSTGSRVHVGTVAVDPRYIPYGTRMFIMATSGSYVYGVSEAEDCGGAIKGDRVDLYLPTYEECMEFGRRVCTVYYLG